MAYYECRVKAVGPADDEDVFVNLAENKGVFYCWFKARKGRGPEVLSTALSAVAMDYHVGIHVGDTKEMTEIARIYLLVP